MKKIFVLAVLAASVFCACEKSGNDSTEQTSELEGLVLNELSAKAKYIELYNNTDAELSLEGVYLVKYDSSKEGGSSVTWKGKAGMTIAAKGYVVLESSDLSDPAEEGDPAYEYESDNHIFKGGLSGKKNVFIELYDAEDIKLSDFKRGDEGAGWNQVSNFENNKSNTFSRVPNGTGKWAYAAPTKGSENGEKTGDIEQEPKVE